MLEDVGVLLKLMKNELYTLFFGFSLGLIYFLISFSDVGGQKYELIISTKYHAVLILMAFCVISTFIVHITCMFIQLQCKYIIKKAEKKENEDPSKSNHKKVINISEMDKNYILPIHIFSLYISSLLFLIPAIWILCRNFIQGYFNFAICVWLLTVVVIVSTIYICSLLGRVTEYYMDDMALIATHRATLVADAKEYAKEMNAQ